MCLTAFDPGVHACARQTIRAVQDGGRRAQAPRGSLQHRWPRCVAVESGCRATARTGVRCPVMHPWRHFQLKHRSASRAGRPDDGTDGERQRLCRGSAQPLSGSAKGGAGVVLFQSAYVKHPAGRCVYCTRAGVSHRLRFVPAVVNRRSGSNVAGVLCRRCNVPADARYA